MSWPTPNGTNPNAANNVANAANTTPLFPANPFPQTFRPGVPCDRESFKDYCMRRLGFPVIQINLDDDQIDDRLEDALQFYRDYHFDGTQLIYGVHTITQQDIDQQFLWVDPMIIGINRVFPLSDSVANVNMFDLRYQLRLNELYDFTSASYVNYTLTMQHLRTIEILFVGETPIRYNRHMNQLFLDWGWGTAIIPGDVAVMECYRIIDADDYPKIWNDRFLKMYATALLKQQWGENLIKYQGVELPGGITLNGERIYREGTREKEKLEKEAIDSYSLPIAFRMG